MPELADWTVLCGVIVVVAFLWNVSSSVLNRIADLRDRVSRLEGFIEGVLGGQDKPSPK